MRQRVYSKGSGPIPVLRGRADKDGGCDVIYVHLTGILISNVVLKVGYPVQISDGCGWSEPRQKSHRGVWTGGGRGVAALAVGNSASPLRASLLMCIVVSSCS